MANKEEKLGINVKKTEDFSEWYNEVVIKSELPLTRLAKVDRPTLLKQLIEEFDLQRDQK